MKLEFARSHKMRRMALLSILLTVVLSVLSTLNLTVLKVSSGVSPYIGVVPETTIDPDITPGMNYTISIYTDYSGDDITGYTFGLTYNPNVLEGLEVVNGDLIVGPPPAPIMFEPGDFNNTEGRLGYTVNGFFFLDPPAPTTSGPGTLANVTFRVIGKGTSDITLETQGSYRTKLVGWTGGAEGDFYNIIDSETMPDHIQHGFFDNRLPYDVAVVSVTAHAEAAVGSVSISAEVANIGKSDEDVEVAVSYDSTPIDNQNVWVAEGASEIVSFSWNTAGLPEGMYTINATATIPDDGDLSDNWNTTTILLMMHDVAVVSVTAPANVTVGSLASINVEVANEGFLAEVANVSIRHDSTLIGFNDTVVLAEGASEIVSFSWNTTGLAQGTHTINATATIPDDGDLSDNWNTTTILLMMHDVAVTGCKASPSIVYVGDLSTISVNVHNPGLHKETFEVEVTYDTNTIEKPKSVTLLSGQTRENIDFNWNTTGVAPDSYTITAKANLVTDQDLTNNLKTYTIVVNPLPGAIAGTVLDAYKGLPVVGATVTADGYSVTTDSTGYYIITDVVAGTYTVTAEASGYYSAIKTSIIVESEVTTTVNFALAVHGVVSEEITNPELVNATNPFVVNATEEAATYLLICEISDPVTIIVKMKQTP